MDSHLDKLIKLFEHENKVDDILTCVYFETDKYVVIQSDFEKVLYMANFGELHDALKEYSRQILLRR